jgi:hypothetical protein
MPSLSSTLDLQRQSLASFKNLFASLQPPEIQSLTGVYRAEFTGPAWLRFSAPGALLLGGLGGWWGKEFNAEGAGVNLVVQGGQLVRRTPMRLVAAVSLIDGCPGLSIHYADGCPFPWPYVIDELRRLDETRLLGMTIVALAWLRKWAFPFLLSFFTPVSLSESGEEIPSS